MQLFTLIELKTSKQKRNSEINQLYVFELKMSSLIYFSFFYFLTTLINKPHSIS